MGVLSERIINEHKDFYNYQILVRQVRHSTACQHIQELLILNNYRKDRPLTYDLLIEFIAFKRIKCKASYINHYVDFAGVWSDYLIYRKETPDPRFKELKYFKIEPVNKSTMSDDEIESFLSLKPQLKGPKYRKGYNTWTLFFSILAYTGMRPNEVATLTIGNVDFGRNVFIVTSENSKTHDQRFVPMASVLVEPLQKHIETCGEYLFMQYTKTFNSVDWSYNFHKRIKRLGIKRPGLTTYSLRHSFITRLLDEDVNLFKVQKIVGHRRVDTTAKYEHLTTKDIQKAVLKHPLIRKNTNPQQVVDAIVEYVKSLGANIKEFEFKRGNLSLEISLTNNT